jgi:5S rRNA maturation endonuclease (ribonuclease M5)
MDIKDLDLKQYIENCTGQRFDKHFRMKSPFNPLDKNPSFYIRYDDNAGKWKFTDFSQDMSGDIIDFDMKYNGTDYVQARKNVGLPVEKTIEETEIDKVENFINWSIENQSFRKGDKLLGIFRYCDANNKTLYFKAKFKHQDGSKELNYFYIGENGKVYNKRGIEYEVPYNLYNALQGMADNKTLVLVEGEKDVIRLNRELNSKCYVVASVKNCKDKGMEMLKSEFMKIYVIPDNDGPGEKYFKNIEKYFLKVSKVFKKVTLKGIQSLGKGADVTDWLEAGYTKDDLYECFNRSLDLKNKEELQQDHRGIYYLRFRKSDDEPIREYITNFNVLEASKVNKVDAEVQGIRIKLQSCIDGKIVEKIGGSKIFDDIRAFRNFLGMDFSFTGKNTNEVVKLKDWINKYFALDNKEIYQGAKFLPVDDGFELITATGTLKADSKDYSTIADQTKIDMLDVPEITSEELQELMQNLFKFCEYSKAISIIGSVISFLEVGQNIAANEKLHHLLIVGESGSGKSTILERVVAPLLNYPVEEKKAISTTTFATQKILSTGNYPVLFDEFKPSMMDQRKIQKLSDMLRNAYDRTTINRGDKSFEIKDFKLTRPIVIAGEESYPNSEKALVTRSCIVYISKHERSEENTKAMVWLMEHEELLKKLGKSLILQALKLPVEEYKSLRTNLRRTFKLNDRPLNTAINIACGIELLNKVLIKTGLQPIGNYTNLIEANIRDEVLDNGEDAYSEVEKMLIMYNNMIQNNNHFVDDDAVQFAKDGKDFGKLFIRTQLMIDAIFKYCNEVKEIDTKTLLTSRDFKKQAKKAGYIKGVNTKQLRIGAYQTYSGKNAWFDEYNKDLLKKLRIDSIVDCDGWEDAVSFAEGQF